MTVAIDFAVVIVLVALIFAFEAEFGVSTFIGRRGFRLGSRDYGTFGAGFGHPATDSIVRRP